MQLGSPSLTQKPIYFWVIRSTSQVQNKNIASVSVNHCECCILLFLTSDQCNDDCMITTLQWCSAMWQEMPITTITRTFGFLFPRVFHVVKHVHYRLDATHVANQQSQTLMGKYYYFNPRQHMILRDVKN